VGCIKQKQEEEEDMKLTFSMNILSIQKKSEINI